MDASLKQYWWMHAYWPLMADYEITQKHIEDIRRFCFLVQFPAAGWYPGSWLGHDEDDDEKTETTIFTDQESGGSDVPLETAFDKGELIIRTSLTKVWTTGEDILKGCWRTKPSDYTVWEALCNMGASGDVEDNDNEPSTGNWREIEEPIIFEYANTVIKNFSGHTEHTIGNFELPDIHPAAGQWLSPTAEWALRWDKNHYSSFDFKSLARWIDHSTNSSSVEEYWDVEAHKFLPRQVPSERLNPFWVYQGSLDVDFREREVRPQHQPLKAYWKKETVTKESAMGAVFAPNLDKDYGINQYWVDAPIPDINNSSLERYNQKMCDSFQTVIEALASNKDLCWPVNDTYIANWEAVNDATWNPSEDDCCPNPSVEDEYWGCNGSGFELLLSELGTDYYDWYLDVDNVYIPPSVQAIIDNFPTYETLKGEPIATWRRTWKYSMGRASDFMRPNEMGTPSSCGETYSIWDGSDSESEIEFEWCGLYVSAMPDPEEFDTIYNMEPTSKTDYTVTVPVAYGVELPVGAKIRIYDSTEDLENGVMAWIVKRTVDGSSLILSLSHSISTVDIGDMMIGVDEYIVARHDPITIEFDVGNTSPYPKYKIKWQMLQHAFELLDECRYYRCWVNLSKKHISMAFELNTWSESVSSDIAQCKENAATFFEDMDLRVDETYSEAEGGCKWDTGSFSGNNSGAATSLAGLETHYDGGVSVIEPGYYVQKSAVKISGAYGDEENWEFANMIGNNSAVKIYIKYTDLKRHEDVSPARDENTLYGGGGPPSAGYDSHIESNQAGIINGLTYDLIASGGAEEYKYGYIYLEQDSDGWCIIESSVANIISSELWVRQGIPEVTIPPSIDGYYNFNVAGYTGTFLSFHQNWLLMEMDFNSIPKSVFIDPDGYDKIGAGEPIGTPDADVNPPVPNPAQINVKPKLVWSQVVIETGETDDEHPDVGNYWRLEVVVTAVVAQDLEENGEYYKIVLNGECSESGETVPEDSYGTSPVCRLKIRDDMAEEVALGTDYSYSGTPTKVSSTNVVIAPADTTSVVAAWRYGITHNGKLHEGDTVWFPNGVSGSGIGKEYTIINIESSSSFDIAMSEQPTAVSGLTIWDTSGYTEDDWNEESNDISDWTVSVICRDNCTPANETELSTGEEIEMPDDWPFEANLKLLEVCRNMYLKDLE